MSESEEKGGESGVIDYEFIFRMMWRFSIGLRRFIFRISLILIDVPK